MLRRKSMRRINKDAIGKLSTGMKARKQISVYVPNEVHRLVTMEAGRRGIHVSDLIKGWIEPHVKKLEKGNQ